MMAVQLADRFSLALCLFLGSLVRALMLGKPPTRRRFLRCLRCPLSSPRVLPVPRRCRLLVNWLPALCRATHRHPPRLHVHVQQAVLLGLPLRPTPNLALVSAFRNRVSLVLLPAQSLVIG
ncbi:uncharacterized protein B0H18DRAFT_968833 [Fomitopsis serialis]|uniref:uncharacterized protein n=1 Tax=Fomitopsis serialis TaxID=139415 RepID=UPI0020083003|nr:uncharacterized protein B0H18DRAFT_968833 [Neoantrodia serialis]KAH9937029.1 hypothetical protein B0H18DRAFT_968833 [Neoantrodia serialis]